MPHLFGLCIREKSLGRIAFLRFNDPNAHSFSQIGDILLELVVQGLLPPGKYGMIGEICI
jgi:hypothetical protein